MQKKKKKSINGQIYIDNTIKSPLKSSGREGIAFREKYHCQEKYPHVIHLLIPPHIDSSLWMHGGINTLYLRLSMELGKVGIQSISLNWIASKQDHKYIIKVKLWGSCMILTAVAVVVYKYDLFEQVWRSPLDGCVDGAQQYWQGLIDKDEDDTELRKICWVRHVYASSGREDQKRTERIRGFFKGLLKERFNKIY